MSHSTQPDPPRAGGSAGRDAATGSGKTGGGRTHRAGAFDMRNFIAALIGIYGIVLTIYGLIGSSDEQLLKSDGVNINLWAGLGMIAVAAGFAVWARLKPVVVPDEVPDHEGTSSISH
jgi:hypothetical protein